MKEEQNSGLGGNANINSSYSIKKLSITGYIGFFRNNVGIQASNNTNYWYGSGIGYKLLKEKLILNVSAVNFFRKEFSYRYTVADKNFVTQTINTQPYRGISIAVTWNFGKLSENVSKKKGVNNDDLVGGSN